jgi:hypothetical protein
MVKGLVSRMPVRVAVMPPDCGEQGRTGAHLIQDVSSLGPCVDGAKRLSDLAPVGFPGRDKNSTQTRTRTCSTWIVLA